MTWFFLVVLAIGLITTGTFVYRDFRNTPKVRCPRARK